MIAALADIAPHWLWLSAGLALAILELLVPGVFLIWIGLAALLTGLLAAALPVPFPAQIVLFALAASGSVFAGRRIFTATARGSGDPLLNDRAGRLVGEVVTVCEAITDGRGRVTVGDGAWPARGPDDVPAGTRVRIVGAEGAVLVVVPVPPPGRPDPYAWIDQEM